MFCYVTQSVTGKYFWCGVGQNCGNRHRRRRRHRGHRLRTRLSRIAGAIPLNRYKRDPIKQPLGYFEHRALMAEYNAIVALDIKTNRTTRARVSPVSYEICIIWRVSLTSESGPMLIFNL